MTVVLDHKLNQIIDSSGSQFIAKSLENVDFVDLLASIKSLGPSNYFVLARVRTINQILETVRTRQI